MQSPLTVCLSVLLNSIFRTDLWPWSFACVWVTTVARRDWNWRSQVKVKMRSVWPRSSIEDNSLVRAVPNRPKDILFSLLCVRVSVRVSVSTQSHWFEWTEWRIVRREMYSTGMWKVDTILTLFPYVCLSVFLPVCVLCAVLELT